MFSRIKILLASLRNILFRALRWTSLRIYFFGLKIGKLGWRKLLKIFIGGLVALYLVGMITEGSAVYGFKLDKKFVWMGANIYPLPAVFVGGRVVSLYTFYQQVGFLEHYNAKTKQKVDSRSEIKKIVLDRLIDGEVAKILAFRQGLSVSSSERNDAFNRIVEESGGPGELRKVLNDLYGMEERQFKKLIVDQILKEKLSNKVKEEVLLRVHVRQILVRDEARAADVLLRVRSGQAFEELAKQFSEDGTSRDRGGDLGWLVRGQSGLQPFDDTVFVTKQGDIPDKIKTGLGFHIIQVLERKEGEDLSYEDWLAREKKKLWIIRLLRF